MSINGEQLEDLKDETVADGSTSVEAPSLLPVSKEKVTIIPENKQFKDQAVQLTEEYEAKLPLMDVQLKLVDGHKSRLVDMEDVENMIASKGTVDQDTSEEVNTAFEGLYDNNLTKHHFTQGPTTINLQRVKNFMRSKISLEEVQLQNSFTELLAKPIDSAKFMLLDIKENYLPSLLSQTYQTRNQAASVPEKIANSQNMFVVIERDMLNLAKVDLAGEHEEPFNVNFNPRFDQLCDNLKELFEDVSFKAHVLAMSNEEDYMVRDNKEQVLEYGTKEVTIHDLVKFFMNSRIIGLVEELYDAVDCGVERLEEFKAEGQDIMDNATAIREYLAMNSVEITETSQNQSKLFTTVRNMITLNFLTQEFFDFYSKQ